MGRPIFNPLINYPTRFLPDKNIDELGCDPFCSTYFNRPFATPSYAFPLYIGKAVGSRGI